MSRDYTIHFIDYDSADEHFEEPECEAEISIISWGSPTSYWDPGEPPEWEIDKIFNHEGEEIPYLLPPRWRDRFEAWFNNQPIKKRFNPEWDRLSELVTKYMDYHFDWSDAQASAAEDYYDYRNEY